MAIEDWGIQEICLIPSDILLPYVVPPVLVNDVLKSVLVHPRAEEHPVEHFRCGGFELLPAGGVERDVAFHRVAHILQRRGCLLGVEVGVIPREPAPGLQESLDGSRLLRHRELEVGVVSPVHEKHTDSSEGDEGHDESHHHRRVDPGFIVILFRVFPLVTEQCQEGEA